MGYTGLLIYLLTYIQAQGNAATVWHVLTGSHRNECEESLGFHLLLRMQENIKQYIRAQRHSTSTYADIGLNFI